MRNSDLTGPIETTGDRQLDQAIARFIHDPRTLRCDERNDWPDYWARGGCDGRPEPRLIDLAHLYDGRRHPGRHEPETTFTRTEVMQART